MSLSDGKDEMMIFFPKIQFIKVIPAFPKASCYKLTWVAKQAGCAH